MEGQLLFLGTGGSLGIPVVGCHCAVCESTVTYNQRYRPSALVTINHKKLLIDATPDFRSQALKFKVEALDGILITHAHHDHTGGIDDLRIYNQRKDKSHHFSLPCLMSHETHEDLRQRYDYMFDRRDKAGSFVTALEVTELPSNRGEIIFKGIPINYITYRQGRMPVNGFRFGNLAFISDINHYPDTIFDDLHGVKTLILSALRFTPSPIHFSVDDALDFSEKVGVEMTYLTHISHELDHEKTNAYLPSRVRLAYDGLMVNFNI